VRLRRHQSDCQMQFRHGDRLQLRLRQETGVRLAQVSFSMSHRFVHAVRRDVAAGVFLRQGRQEGELYRAVHGGEELLVRRGLREESRLRESQMREDLSRRGVRGVSEGCGFDPDVSLR
jgi:hypothetical protein